MFNLKVTNRWLLLTAGKGTAFLKSFTLYVILGGKGETYY
jgi:hypothetical protein